MYNNIKIKNMNKEFIDKIRCMLDFLEESDTLISEARRNGDMEREEELLAGLSNAERDLKTCVSLLLRDEKEGGVSATDKEKPF